MLSVARHRIRNFDCARFTSELFLTLADRGALSYSIVRSFSHFAVKSIGSLTLLAMTAIENPAQNDKRMRLTVVAASPGIAPPVRQSTQYHLLRETA